MTRAVHSAATRPQTRDTLLAYTAGELDAREWPEDARIGGVRRGRRHEHIAPDETASQPL